MDPGCRKPQRGFWLPGNTSDPDAILLESAIDALSAILLVLSRPPYATTPSGRKCCKYFLTQVGPLLE